MRKDGAGVLNLFAVTIRKIDVFGGDERGGVGQLVWGLGAKEENPEAELPAPPCIIGLIED